MYKFELEGKVCKPYMQSKILTVGARCDSDFVVYFVNNSDKDIKVRFIADDIEIISENLENSLWDLSANDKVKIDIESKVEQAFLTFSYGSIEATSIVGPNDKFRSVILATVIEGNDNVYDGAVELFFPREEDI